MTVDSIDLCRFKWRGFRVIAGVLEARVSAGDGVIEMVEGVTITLVFLQIHPYIPII